MYVCMYVCMYACMYVVCRRSKIPTPFKVLVQELLPKIDPGGTDRTCTHSGHDMHEGSMSK